MDTREQQGFDRLRKLGPYAKELTAMLPAETTTFTVRQKVFINLCVSHCLAEIYDMRMTEVEQLETQYNEPPVDKP